MPIIDNELLPDEGTQKAGQAEIRHNNIADWVSDTVKKNLEVYGDKTWLTDVCTGAQIRYSELIPIVKRISSALHKRGFQRDDNLLFIATNFLEVPLAMFAVFHLGGCTVNLTQNIPQNDIRARCLEMKPKFVLTDEIRAERVLGAVKDLDFVQEVFVIGQHKGCIPFSALVNDDGSSCPPIATLDESARAFVMYSSGTTGMPKAIAYTPRAIIGSASLSNMSLGSCRKIMFNNLIINSGGLLMLFLVTLGHNEGIVFSEFDDNLLVPAIDKYKPEIVSAFPTQVTIICKTPEIEKYDLSSVRIFYCGGSSMNPFYERELFNKLPNMILLLTAYGMTESGMCVHNIPTPAEMRTLTPEAARKRHLMGSCGRVMPGCRLKVIDENTKEKLGPNQSGELCVKSPTIMTGYLGNEEATRNTVIDGWVHTGDKGYYDEHGNVFITGRIKELIKYKIAHVVPANIEKYLGLHPDIADAAVVGLPDDVAGELPLAFVVRKEGSSLTEQDVVTYIEGHVADEERLRGGVRFIDEIPRNDFRKTMRHVLLKLAMETQS